MQKQVANTSEPLKIDLHLLLQISQLDANMDKASMCGQTVENTPVNGKKTSKMVKDNSSTQTESFTSVTGLMGLRTVKENRTGKMALNTTATGSTTQCKAPVTINLQTAVSTKEIGSTTNSMERENRLGLMAEATRVISIMELKREKVYIHGLMERNMKDLGAKVNNMVMVCSRHPKEK